jgi:hypothetical protein
MRLPAAAVALACLLLVPAIALASDYDNFIKAYDKGDYTKAAKLAIAMGGGGRSVTGLERFGNACTYAGRIPEAIGFKVQRLYREEFHGQVTSTVVFNEARSIAQLAVQHKVTPDDEIIAAIAMVEAGDTLGGVRALHRRYVVRGYGVSNSLRGDALKAYVFPAFGSAIARGDMTSAGELAKCRPIWTPEQYRPDVLRALEAAGDVSGAVSQAYDDAFTGQQGYGPYTYAGNPVLVVVAAEIAHRHQYASDIPLVAAYAKYLAGDAKGAIAEVERIAGRPDGDVINDTVCVARFVAGDLWRKQGDLPQGAVVVSRRDLVGLRSLGEALHQPVDLPRRPEPEEGRLLPSHPGFSAAGRGVGGPRPPPARDGRTQHDDGSGFGYP